MKIVSIPRIAFGSAIAGSALLLTGCYVVPIQPATHPAPVVVPAAPSPVTFAGRLYPANEAAAPYGVVEAIVTNDLNGRGAAAPAGD